MAQVTFLPQKETVEIEEGRSLLEAAEQAGVAIDGNCGGAGVCGNCKVQIQWKNGDGSTWEQTAFVGDPAGILSQEEIDQGYRLACREIVRGTMIVTLPDSRGAAGNKGKLMHLLEGFQPKAREGYGVSVDIGTTTVVVMLWKLMTGEAVAVDAFTNPQSNRGADVISRITYIMENPEKHLEELRGLLVRRINETLEKFCKEQNISQEEIRDVVVVGNTTMSTIFAGVDPKGLAVAPFEMAFSGGTTGKEKHYGMEGAEDAELYIPPNIAGHVGSDITAGLLTTKLAELSSCRLYIDLGTNGEIVLTGNGKSVACSTAAGPAFEGRSVEFGMRGATGAIEHVVLTSAGVELQVIGDGEPMGICGSGIIDALGELVRTGIVDSTGRILSQEELRGRGIPEAVLAMIRTCDDVSDFLLYRGEEREEDVYLTQKDIRQVQLAKAAIAAGIEILMKTLGVHKEDLEEVMIAGAFGSYVRISGALHMGLLPGIEADRIHSIGNAAGAGASMLLLNPDWRGKTERMVSHIQHVELATEPGFQEAYMKAMAFSLD